MQAGFFFTLVVLVNLIDYNANFQFVKHVLEMDTTYLSPKVMGRVIESHFMHTFFYLIIISVELLCGLLLWFGGIRLMLKKGDSVAFNRAKGAANLGLFIGITLYFTGFISIGGEWFLMWQSSAWSGVNASARFATLLFFILLFLNQKEPE